MSTNQNTLGKMSNYRWTICAMLFFATTVNYLDRQVLSLTWKDFIAPEFHWTDADYGDITAVFSIVYAIANLFAGRFIDWLGTKKGYLWAIFVWSLGACLHAVCGWATEHVVGIHDAAAMISATGAVASTIAITSVYFFIAARVILIPTALFLLMALSVFWFFCMSLAFIPACRAYRAFSRPSPTSPALFTGAATVLTTLTAAPPKDTVRPLFLYSCSSFPL